MTALRGPQTKHPASDVGDNRAEEIAATSDSDSEGHHGLYGQTGGFPELKTGGPASSARHEVGRPSWSGAAGRP